MVFFLNGRNESANQWSTNDETERMAQYLSENRKLKSGTSRAHFRCARPPSSAWISGRRKYDKGPTARTSPDNTEFLQPYSAAGDAMLNIETAVIPAVLSLDAVTTEKLFPCPEMLLPVGILSSYSELPCQNTSCWMLHEQLQTIQMRRGLCSRIKTHVLFVNTPRSHLQFLRNWRRQRPSNQGHLDSKCHGGG